MESVFSHLHSTLWSQSSFLEWGLRLCSDSTNEWVHFPRCNRSLGEKWFSDAVSNIFWQWLDFVILMAENLFNSPTSHTFLNILATFGHLKEKIIICYSMYADREGIELFASFCSMWIDQGIIEISDIKKDNVNTTQWEQLDLVC